MEKEPLITEPVVAWGVASRALPGQNVCGDLHLVKPFTGGVLLAAVDGIGHGEEADVAAKAAVAVLERDAGEPLEAVVRRCHESLLKTRGVVMTLGALDPCQGQLKWLGVGNVEAVLLRADPRTKTPSDRVVLRSGLVGYQLPELRVNTVAVSHADVLVFVTDGIAPCFSDELVCSDSPQQTANRILERHFKGSDDALVLVARYLGGGHE